MMKLISAKTSPFARKVRIALHEKALPFELIEDVPWNPDSTTSQFNPLEKLPVLVLDDGTNVYDSRLILEWLEHHHPEPPLLSREPREAFDARRLEVLADGALDALVLLFWEQSRPHPSAPWADRQRRKISGGLREIAATVGGNDYAIGGRFGHGDVVVGAALGAFELMHSLGHDPLLGIDHWKESHPGLIPYHQRLERRPSFIQTSPSFFEDLQSAT